MGGMFIAVVLLFPRGLAGLMTDQVIPRIARLRNGSGTPHGAESGAGGVTSWPSQTPTFSSRSKTSRSRSTASRR